MKDLDDVNLLIDSVANRAAHELSQLLVKANVETKKKLSLLGSNQGLLQELFKLYILNDDGLPASERTKLEGAKEKYRMLNENGGLFSTKDVSDLLQLQPQSITGRRKRKELLAIQIGGKWKYPVFQFENLNLIKGLSRVNKALMKQGSQMFWDACQFLLNEHNALIDDEGINLTPIESLKRGQSIDCIIKLAANHFDVMTH